MVQALADPPGAAVDAAAIAARLAHVRDRVAATARAAGRSPDDVTIVAVTKTWPPAVIAAAADAGQRHMAESRARDLRDKARDPLLAGRDLIWHFVGRLQTNKVKHVVGTYALVHSLDRWDLAEALDHRADFADTHQDVLIQVNIDGDPRKAGVSADGLAAFTDRVAGLAHLRVRGLMTIPALDADPAAAFDRLRRLRDAVARDHPGVVHLSMGMSRDYEQAVARGATMVRPGEAVFGPRRSNRDRQPPT